jgi:hypothetical protein
MSETVINRSMSEITSINLEKRQYYLTVMYINKQKIIGKSTK